MSFKSAEKTETNVYSVELTIGADAFAKATEEAYKRNKGKIQVPGFRKGKAPRSFIEKYYGEGVFYEDALDIAFPEAYSEALKDAEFEPVDNPFDFDIKSVGKDGAELAFKVTVKPEAEVGEYKGLKAVKEDVEVTAEEVEAAVNRTLEQNARMIPVEDRAVEKGDIVKIDFEGFDGDKAFDGGKAEDYELEIGGGQFIPGFEDQVIGHNVNDEFDINVTFPEDYGAEELAGKPVVFKIKLHEIKVKEIPEADDEFAKDVSEFDTFDEYKADVEKNILEGKQAEADRAFRNSLLDQVADSVEAEIPEVMIEKAIDDALNEFNYRLQMQGMNLETYMQYTGMEMSALRDSYKDKAENDVKLMLALEKISKLEGIEVTDEDVDAEYAKYAEMYGMEVEKLKEMIPVASVKSDLGNSKAIDFIVDNAIAEKAEKTEAAEDSAE